MTNPTSPPSPGDKPPIPLPTPPGGSSDVGGYSSQNIDPTGVWAKFLSTPGHPATKQEVGKFVAGLMKNLSLIIQRDLARAKKEAQKLKRAAEGKD